jgi:hypothetical protein
LFDDVADRLGMRERAVVLVVHEIAECVEAEDERELRGFAFLGECFHDRGGSGGHV